MWEELFYQIDRNRVRYLWRREFWRFEATGRRRIGLVHQVLSAGGLEQHTLVLRSVLFANNGVNSANSVVKKKLKRKDHHSFIWWIS